ncbi:Pentatricopeptide repeat [Cinnamomum micranthum f. kanehirae]|uniref:Pentatricopeptide repeat n=1 Tax=Cinnamomum micranthum f. kanehirae TaxID=337451 RepID=A0A443NCB1_9MAGN|nr:Pentatricopeptide repeat [Cinnamomum micranthum f. kanehirae]
MLRPHDHVASVLHACTQLRAVDCATQVHDFSIKAGSCSDVYVGAALIDFYSKNGDIEGARIVFDELPVRNAVTWTTIITCYSQAGRSEVSFQLFNQMRQTGTLPDRYVLSSYLEGGKQIHGYVLRNGVDMDVSVNNVLIDLYSKCHRVRYARKVFDDVVIKNTVSWMTMIAGYMQNAYYSDAMELLSEMSRLGWCPDGFTCTTILTSCGSLGALEKGKQVHSYTIKTNLACDEFVKNGLIDMYAKCDPLADARTTFDAVVEHNVVSYNAMIEGYASNGEALRSIEPIK